MNILVVEDDTQFKTMLCEILAHCGHTVLTAEDGEEAFRALRQSPVQLIISDIQMPKCMGTQLHEMVRDDERLKETPFMYMTGYSVLRSVTPLDKTGHDFIVNKVPFARLLQMVDGISNGGENIAGDRLECGAS